MRKNKFAVGRLKLSLPGFSAVRGIIYVEVEHRACSGAGRMRKAFLAVLDGRETREAFAPTNERKCLHLTNIASAVSAAMPE